MHEESRRHASSVHVTPEKLMKQLIFSFIICCHYLLPFLPLLCPSDILILLAEKYFYRALTRDPKVKLISHINSRLYI